MVWFCFFVFLFFPLFFKGGYLGFCFLRVLGVAFFLMVPSLCSPLVRNTPFLHCFGLFTLGDFLRHVKSVHLLVCFISQASLGYFYLCKCLILLCFSLVLFFLLFVVGFELSLAPFWGCLSLVLCALVCFIGPSNHISQVGFSLTLWSNYSRFNE